MFLDKCFGACIKYVLTPLSTEIEQRGPRHVRFNVPKCYLEVAMFLPLRLSCTVSTVLSIKNENKDELFQTEIFSTRFPFFFFRYSAETSGKAYHRAGA